MESIRAPSENGASPYGGRLKQGEIRLVTVEWASESRTLHLKTVVVNLSSEPEFDAISYVWGTQDASVAVDLNGCQTNMTPSAFEMLQYLCWHRPDPERPLWIDAICINQSDSQEKAMQIPLMQHIYTMATRVVVWLGMSSPSTVRFMDDFPRVFQLALHWTPRLCSSNPHWRGPHWPPDTDPFWPGLFHLLNNEWFKRLWTVQEIVLARQAIMMCGSAYIDADRFIDFVSDGQFKERRYIYYLSEHRALVPGNPTSDELAAQSCHLIQLMRVNRRNGLPGMRSSALSDGLQQLRRSHVHEQVDRVWAIAGLLDDRIREEIAPMVDYSIAGRREYWVTHANFVKAILPQFCGMELLVIPHCTASARLPLLPSWCPDLSGPPACFKFLDGTWNNPLVGRAANFRKLLTESEEDEKESLERQVGMFMHPMKHISTAQDTTIIHVRGAILDSITEVVQEEILIGTQHYRDTSDWDMFNMKHAVHAAAVRQLDQSLALARRIFQGANHPDNGIPLDYLRAFHTDNRISETTAIAYNDFINAMKTQGRSTDGMTEERYDNTWNCIERYRYIIGCSFFATTAGRFGIAYPGCKPGDKVCILYGAEPLYILRWQGSESSVGTEHGSEPAGFVGPAFIPHLMEAHQAEAARLSLDEIFSIK